MNKLKNTLGKFLFSILPNATIPHSISQLLISHMTPTDYIDQWSAQPFNGQIRRAETIHAISRSFKPTVCIETGTYFGTSTPHLASMVTGKTYTIEINDRNYERAVDRFRKNFDMFDIVCIKGNSVIEMKKVLESLDPRTEKLLAYLDAHWLDDVPTKQELQLLCDWGGLWVGIVDDFHVPKHAGYLFDSYPNATINVSQIPQSCDLSVFVPRISAELESGAKRGTAYVFPKAVLVQMDQAVFKDLELY